MNVTTEHLCNNHYFIPHNISVLIKPTLPNCCNQITNKAIYKLLYLAPSHETDLKYYKNLFCAHRNDSFIQQFQ